jgi:DNA-binding HxlR family transcriptional regulator
MSDTNLLETMPPWNVFDSHCPTRQVLDLIADKWTVLIIRRLSDGTLRFAQLRRAVDGISQKVLTNTLRGLERNGIVTRRIYARVPPKVEYSLTVWGDRYASWSEASVFGLNRTSSKCKPREVYDRTAREVSMS